MPNAVIENRDLFAAFLSAQPLCQWSAEKQREMAAGRHPQRGSSPIHTPAPKNDNAELAEAMSSMA